MTNDIPYKHPETGRERFFPEGLGEKLGYERVQDFTPPEISEPEDKPLSETREAEVEHAVIVLSGTLANGYDSLSNKERIHLDQLLKVMIEEYGIETVDHPGYKETLDGLEKLSPSDSSAPSLVEVIQAIEAKMEGDAKISATAKAAMKKHFDELLAEQADITTNPQTSTPDGSQTQTDGSNPND